jgi:hypothetical protein
LDARVWLDSLKRKFKAAVQYALGKGNCAVRLSFFLVTR